MKKRLSKKLETKGMSNKKLVKFLNGVILRQDRRIESQKATINSASDRMLALVKDNIKLTKDCDKLEKQNMAMSLQSIRLSEEVKFLNQEINELQAEKENKWWKKVLGL